VRRAGAAAVAAMAVVSAGGCTVGSGVGTATGSLYVFSCTCDAFDCKVGADLGSPGAPAAFDLSPHFFAGEPIDDISRSRIANNRLIIRMSRNGNRPEINDTLFFDIQSVREIARCVRGRVNADGTPDWDVAGGWCDWTGGQGGNVQAARPRITVGPELPVRSSLSLLYTCGFARTVGNGVDGSWIEFEDFSGVAEPDLPPAMRGEIAGNFKVDFGSRLRATFNVVLDDERRIIAKKVMDPIPAPNIDGQMAGAFDFDLERGRAAQLFP
jgi:hypothetical protein